MTDQQPDDDDGDGDEWTIYIDHWGVTIPTDIAAVVGGYLGLALWFVLLVLLVLGFIFAIVSLPWF